LEEAFEWQPNELEWGLEAWGMIPSRAATHTNATHAARLAAHSARLAGAGGTTLAWRQAFLLELRRRRA